MATSSGVFFFMKSAHADVHVLGVFADHDEVDVLRALAGQRGFDAGEQFHRPQVDVLVEAEPQFQEQALFEDAGGDVGMAHRAQQNGGKGAQFVERLGRHDLAGPQIALAAEIEVLQFDLIPSKAATALRTFTPSAATSGPVPSPPITATLRTLLLMVVLSSLVKSESREKRLF